jgi:Flp pilus assembly protein TadD
MTETHIHQLLEGAEALLDARRYNEVLQLAAQACAVDPTNPTPYTTAARALTELGRHNEAIGTALEAVARAPNSAYAHRICSLALSSSPANSSQPGAMQAVTMAEKAVRLAPYDVGCYLALARACAIAGMFTPADEAVRTALQLAPSSANSWVSASFVAIRARSWSSAESAARRALALDPGNYAATNNLGVALRHQGSSTLGAIAFLDAARIDPRSPEARNNVEGIGFRYFRLLVPFLLLPLLIVWPVFVAARLALSNWLASKPERLRPLARSVGIRVASSKRYRRKFEQSNARAQKMLERSQQTNDWSALSGRHLMGDQLLRVIAGSLLLTGLIFVMIAIFAATSGGSIIGFLIVALLFGAGAVAVFGAVARRRRASF